MHTNSTENIQNNKEAKNARGSGRVFSRIYIFHRFYIEQQILRPTDNKRKRMFYSGKKKRDILYKDTDYG